MAWHGDHELADTVEAERLRRERRRRRHDPALLWDEFLGDLRRRLRAAVGEENSRELDSEEHIETVVDTLAARGVLARRFDEFRRRVVR